MNDLSKIMKRFLLAALLAVPVFGQTREFVRTFDTITAWRATTPDAQHRTVIVRGLTAVDDGGGGSFAWMVDASAPSWVADPDTDRTGMYYDDTLAGSDGVWVRQWTGPVQAQWLGLKCDGTTDDSSAFDSAMDLVNANNWTLEFPASDTYLTGLITLSDMTDVSIIGQGKGLSRIVTDFGANPSTSQLIYFDTATNVVIKGLSFIGDNTSTNTGAYELVTFSQPNVQRVTVQDCEFKNARHAGLRFVSSSLPTDIRVINCDFEDCGLDGDVDDGGALLISSDGATGGRIQVKGCTFKNCGNLTDNTWHGAYFSSVPYVNFVGNVCDGSTGDRSEIKLAGCVGSEVSGNTFRYGYQWFNSTATTIVGNTFEHTRIYIEDRSNFSGNVARGDPDGAYPLRLLKSGGNLRNARIANNMFINSEAAKTAYSSFPINSSTSFSDCVIENNYFWRMPIARAYIAPSTNNVFSGNHVYWPDCTGNTNTTSYGLLYVSQPHNKAINNTFDLWNSVGEVYSIGRLSATNEVFDEFWGNKGASALERQTYMPDGSRNTDGSYGDVNRWGRTWRDGRPAYFAANDSPVGYTNWWGGDVVIESGRPTGNKSSDIELWTVPAGASGTTEGTKTLAITVSSTGELVLARGGITQDIDVGTPSGGEYSPDLLAADVFTVSMGGDLILTNAVNVAAGRSVQLRVLNDQATNCVLSLDQNWLRGGEADPITVGTNLVVRVTLQAFGPNATDVDCASAVLDN